jgi:hypothetical protein
MNQLLAELKACLLILLLLGSGVGAFWIGYRHGLTLPVAIGAAVFAVCGGVLFHRATRWMG